MREAKTDKFSGGFSMKRLSRVLPFVLAAIVAAATLYGQSQDGTVNGRVLDRDGKTPLVGATIWIDSLVTNNGRIQMRERLTAKTGRDGRYSMSGLYIGRVRVTVVVNNQAVMVRGEAIGDELFLATGVDTVANFDLSKAPAAPPATEAGATPAPGNEKDREELRKKLEAEAAAAGEVNKFFEAGKTAFAAKNYTDAIQNFKSATEKIPNPPPAGVADVVWANLGKAYDANRQYTEAAAAYKKAVEYKPTESNYYVNLSLAQIGSGQIEESRASIEKAAQLNPANAGMAYYNLAVTLINRNQNNEAVEALKKAIELDPKYANAHYQLGIVSVGKNEMAEAQAYFTKYLELAPTGEFAEVAKQLIEATKGAGTTSFSSPDAGKSKADTKGKQPAKTKN
jgi:tetratricopeptide (TPR) repeat protein